MRRVAGWAVVVIVLLAGCATKEPDPVPVQASSGAPPPTEYKREPLPPTLEAADADGGSWLFDPGTGRDTETSLAVDPHNARRVLVAWQEAITRIWVAFTEDAGDTWTVERIQDPAYDQQPDQVHYWNQEAFDVTTAVLPDGTFAILFGGMMGDAEGTAATPGGVTFARRDDHQWSYHHVSETETPFVWDAMHLAVAPDSGKLFATAQSISNRAIAFWTSDDGGRTWSTNGFPQLVNAASSAQAQMQDGFQYWPRLTAGANGLVALATKAGTSNQPRVMVSRDGGATFGPVLAPFDETLPGSLIGMPICPVGDGVQVAYATDDGVRLAEIRSLGASWEAGARAPILHPRADWATCAPGPNGTLFVLHGADDPTVPVWSMSLTRFMPDTVTSVVLSTDSTMRPRGEGAGDEYGGLGIDSDGVVWASFAEPAPEGAAIRVLRLALRS